MILRRMLVLGGLALATALSAHEPDGLEHPADATSQDRPHRLADGRLQVSKSAQHLLGLRTEPYTDAVPERVELLGEVIPHPQALGTLTAPQPGRLEARAGSWPLAGTAVKAGEVLAVLHPLMSERERAQRRASLASIEQKLNLARVNAGRMRLQSAAIGEVPVRENIYLEQAEAELATQERQLVLARETLEGAVSIRAGSDGVLSAVHAKPGEIVAAGAALFELASASYTRIAIAVFDPGLSGRIRSAQLRLSTDRRLPLHLAGQEPEAARPGWRLLLDAQDDLPAPLFKGQLLSIDLELAPASSRCDATSTRVWVHVAPEVFELRAVSDCSNPLLAGDRRVVRGAALLDAYLDAGPGA